MLKYIERLRQEPEKTRRRYAFGISLFVVIIIAGIWFVNHLYLSSLPADSQTVSEKNPSPTESIVSTFKDGYSNIKKALMASPWKALPDEKVATTTPEKVNEVIITDTPN